MSSVTIREVANNPSRLEIVLEGYPLRWDGSLVNRWGDRGGWTLWPPQFRGHRMVRLESGVKTYPSVWSFAREDLEQVLEVLR